MEALPPLTDDVCAVEELTIFFAEKQRSDAETVDILKLREQCFDSFTESVGNTEQ